MTTGLWARASPPPSALPTASVSSAVCLTRRPRRKIPRSTTRSGPSAVKATSRRHLRRGRFPGRQPEARQPDRDLRCQPHPDRRRHQPGAGRGRAQALPGIRWYTDEFSFIQPDGSYKEDIEGLADVIAKAEKAAPDQPKLIKVHSLIAWPTPGKTNDPSSHGSKLGTELLPASRKPSATIRKRTSTLTKRLWLTLARLPSAVSKPTRNGTRSSTLGARPTRTRLPCTTV